ncbi:hypothetical protein RI367_005950 [Sorochytrium milnesiophthora]
MPTDTTERLTRLRKLMQEPQNNVHAYVVPSEDAHQSEYSAACDHRRPFISGFTGSAGLAVVTIDQAALWTDGRYFLQASQQLDSNWTLMKAGLPDTPTKEAWLSKVLAAKSRVGIDPTLFSISAAKVLREALEKDGHELVALPNNLVDQVWGADRPAVPKNPLTVLDVKYSGKKYEDKISELRAELAKKKSVVGVVLSALDQIAWLFNLRGSDVQYNPVFISYAYVSHKEAILYIDDKKITDQVQQHLGTTVTRKPYEVVFDDLSRITSALAEDEKIMVDAGSNLAIIGAIGKDRVLEEQRNPVVLAKALKNPVEVEGFRQSHIRDAAAVVKYFAWLENELVNNKRTDLDEVDVADKLESFRAEQKDFVGLSFDTISGSGSNGAIIHYKPEKGSCSKVTLDHLYLCDSGGQYLDGTTDITRTVHFGTPTEREKECFTRVLQGHIGLDRAVFPKGTTGYALDILARAPLWSVGLDFRHGTGHGVGHYLNVHEGPQSISFRLSSNDVPLQAGMTVTNEPGYYEDGKFGIRIENVLVVRDANTPDNFGDRGYLGFEPVTVVPMQKKLIKTDLLTSVERDWINSYHKLCWEKVSPLLKSDTLAYEYLKREVAPL